MSDCDSDDTVLYGVSQKVENDYLAGLRCCDISDNDDDVFRSICEGAMSASLQDNGFSDASDSELVSASQVYDNASASVPEGAANCSAVLDRCGTRRTIGRVFREPVADDSLEQLKYSRFPRNTVNKSTWVVTLFGEWRAQRNRRCLEDPNGSLVYLNKPFSDMTDEEYNYCLPLFLCEVLKTDGTEFPPDTLRQMVLALQVSCLDL